MTNKTSIARAARVLAGAHPSIAFEDVRAAYGLDDSFQWSAATLASYVDQLLLDRKKPSYDKLADTLSALIGAFSDIDAMLDNYMSQCDATKAESRTSKAANRVHAKAITVCAKALMPAAGKELS